jgi:hypothetical protein
MITLCVFLILKPPDDMAKNSHLEDLKRLGPLTVLRADLDVEGSFDDAVAGCDYAFLVAAPVNLAAGEDPEVSTDVVTCQASFISINPFVYFAIWMAS